MLAEARTLDIGLEHRIGRAIGSKAPIAEWIPEHAAWLLNHERVGEDVATPTQRFSLCAERARFSLGTGAKER